MKKIIKTRNLSLHMKEEIFETLQNTLGKQDMFDLSRKSYRTTSNIRYILDLTFHEDDKVAFRAAWLLETICFEYTSYFYAACKSQFLERFAAQKNQSARRHFAKILSFMTSMKAPLFENIRLKRPDNTEPLVNTIFEWLIDENTPVAVKSHCLDILANLEFLHPWVKIELQETMDYLVDKESIAFFAKVKQIRKKLGIKNSN